MQPAVALFNFMRSKTLSRIFLLGFFAGFSLYISYFIASWNMQLICNGRGGGAQRPVLRVKKPKKTGAAVHGRTRPETTTVVVYNL